MAHTQSASSLTRVATPLATRTCCKKVEKANECRMRKRETIPQWNDPRDACKVLLLRETIKLADAGWLEHGPQPNQLKDQSIVPAVAQKKFPVTFTPPAASIESVLRKTFKHTISKPFKNFNLNHSRPCLFALIFPHGIRNIHPFYQDFFRLSPRHRSHLIGLFRPQHLCTGIHRDILPIHWGCLTSPIHHRLCFQIGGKRLYKHLLIHSNRFRRTQRNNYLAARMRQRSGYCSPVQWIVVKRFLHVSQMKSIFRLLRFSLRWLVPIMPIIIVLGFFQFLQRDRQFMKDERIL